MNLHDLGFQGDMLIHENQDPRMLPFTAFNRGPGKVTFKSFLEEEKWNLCEHEADREIICRVGQRVILPHEFYNPIVEEGKTADIHFDLGKRADLKGYTKLYKQKILMPNTDRPFSIEVENK